MGRCPSDHLASTATPEEQLGRHEILRAPSGLRARPQNDIVFLEGGCRPLHPCFTSANIAFCFLCILLYAILGRKFVSNPKNRTAFAVVLLVFITQKESQKRFSTAQTSDFQKVFAFESTTLYSCICNVFLSTIIEIAPVFRAFIDYNRNFPHFRREFRL